MLLSRKKLSLALLISSAISVPAFASSITLDAVGSYGYISNTAVATQSAEFGYPGGAVLFDVGSGSRVHFELGGWLVNRQWEDNSTTPNNSATWARATAGVNLHYNRFIYLSVGGFYGWQMTGTTYQPITANLPQDYGPEGGIHFGVPLGRGVDLDLGARIFYGLNNYSGVAGTTVNATTDFAFLAGFRFGGIGGR